MASLFRPKGEGRVVSGSDNSNRAPPKSSSRLSKDVPVSTSEGSKQSVRSQLEDELSFQHFGPTKESYLGVVSGVSSNLQGGVHDSGELRQAYDTLVQSYRAQEGELEGFNQVLAQNEHDLQIVRTQLANAREELSSCKDDLFRMQPITQVPDTDILRDFEQVCENIVGWIDEELLFFEKANPESQEGQLFSNAGSDYLAYLLRSFPDIGEDLVGYEVHRLLQKSILNSDNYFFAMNNESAEFFKSLEYNMLNSNPPKGSLF